MAKKQTKKYIPEDEFLDDVKEVERLMKLIRAEYNQFFGGISKVPPVFHEEKARRVFKKYQGGDLLRKAVDRYRFYNLQARFNADQELYGRKLRALEGGKVFGRQAGQGVLTGVHVPSAKDGGKPPTPAEKAQGQTYKYTAISKDPTQEKATVERLYKEYQRANSMVGKDASKVSVSKFQDYLTKQVQAVKSKATCEAVRFTLKVVDGEVKLTAKVAK